MSSTEGNDEPAEVDGDEPVYCLTMPDELCACYAHTLDDCAFA